MFSSRTPRLFAAALMDLAEAMLRPVDVDEESAPPAGAAVLPGSAGHHSSAAQRSAWWTGEEPFADLPSRRQRSENELQHHPLHRRRLREPRTRRPGAVAPQSAACTTPVGEPRSPRTQPPSGAPLRG